MDRKKSIIIAITGNLFTDQRIIRIASTLVSNGYNVTVYFREYYKYNYKSSENVKNHTFKTRKLKFIFNNGIAFYLFYNLRLFLILLLKRTSIYCAIDADTLPAFIVLSKIKNIKLVFDAHEYFAEVPELEGNYKKKKVWHWVTQLGINQSTSRYTVSKSLANALEDRYGKPFDTIRNLPLYKEKDVHLKTKPPTIIYQGALNKGRELELLIAAMKQLPDFKCIIIGEGDLSESLRALASSSSNIEFTGLLSPEKINRITQSAFLGYNLLDATSLSYYYSLSNKYFDYMQVGVPSISSQLPEYELLNKTFECGICIPNKENEIIHIIKYCYENKEYYLKLQQNALLASLKNNWENESEKLIKIFNCL